ncbi:hypothetical protein GGR56DRAFT_334277 [Xylariaceae sp. FL0804]|nr:hypothetical protein GGR56DRAFT_334277 [Xylariaceae sp. FL0804]
MQQSHTHAVLDVGLGTLAFRSTKRKRPSSAAEGDDRHRKRALIDYAMSLTFLPTDPKKCHMLVATIFQEESSMRGVSSISRLMVNRVLPAGSPVFELVREGRLRELQEMMHRGEASLRDHDDKRLRTILNCELNAGSSLPPNEFSAVQRCRRLLLEAGADPTAQDFLRMAIATRHTETVGLASQDFGWPWPHINNLKWSFNRPAISVSCTGWLEDLVVTKEFISQLLDLGADIHLRADDGETCLHAFFQQKTLKFPTIDFSEVIIGSYTGDLWDAVLQSRGFDLAEFRHGYQRRAKYTKSYTRHNFEALWKGREALCPYWDDTPWPPEGTCGMTSENSGSVPCRGMIPWSSISNRKRCSGKMLSGMRTWLSGTLHEATRT